MTSAGTRRGIVAAIGHRFADASVEQQVAGAEAVFHSYPNRPFQDVADDLQPAEVIVIGTLLRLGRGELERLRHVKGIVRYGIGVDNIDLEACRELGIVVCNVPDYATDEVATHAIALLLTMARQIPQADRLCRTRGWLQAASQLQPLELAGATLGVVGAGRIGRRLLEMAAGFPWRRVSFDPYAQLDGLTASGVTPASSLDDLLRQTDFLSLHLPSQDDRPLIGARELGIMPRGGILVNCARGSLIDSEALADALASGHLAGAGLDVADAEPIPEGHPLLEAPNLVVTGHTAWISRGAKARLRRLAAEEAVRLVRGEPPKNPVFAS